MKSPLININICEDKESSLKLIMDNLSSEGYNIHCIYNHIPDSGTEEIIIINTKDINSPLLKQLSAAEVNKSNIIIILPEEDSLFASTVVKNGFSNLFVFPYEYYLFIDFLREMMDNNFNELDNSTENSSKDSFENIKGNSKEMRKLIGIAKRIADKHNVNILITGETGTGKGMFARAIHDYNNPDNTPFVDITCTSIPESLLETELFGHEAGAFTNARFQKQGLFEIAENGTLFLDEIGDISLNIQSKLLRTLDKKVIRRVGGIVDIPINSRIISATNADIEENISRNLFRRDLFHRLNTVSLELPPLRERGNDARILAEYFINHYSVVMKKQIKKIDTSFIDYINRYSWPGNVRELRNFIERHILLSEGKILALKQDLISNAKIKSISGIQTHHPSIIHLELNYERTNLKMIEKIYAQETLNKFNGNKSKTARALGISRPKLDDLLNN